MERLLKALTHWGPVVLWCAVIFALSDIPSLRISEAWWDFVLRKVAHLTEYAVLSWLVVRALAGTTSWPTPRILCTALAFSVLYAISDEWHQSFVPGRTGSVVDVGIDALGAATGILWRNRP